MKITTEVCETPYLDCEDCQDCFNEGESIRKIKNVNEAEAEAEVKFKEWYSYYRNSCLYQLHKQSDSNKHCFITGYEIKTYENNILKAKIQMLQVELAHLQAEKSALHFP